MESTNECATSSFSSGVCCGSRQVKINFLGVFLFTMARVTSSCGTCDLILESLMVTHLFVLGVYWYFYIDFFL